MSNATGLESNTGVQSGRRDHASAQLFGMSWAHFLNDGSANYLPGILPAVLISLHEKVSMAGVLMAALLIGQALQPLMGWIADRLGGRSLIVIGLAGSTLGGALLGFADKTWEMIGFLFLIGVGNALFHPQALAVVRGIVQSRQGLGLSIFMVGGELGRGAWPTAASFVVIHYHIQSLWILAVPAVITIPFLMRYAPTLPKRKVGGQPIQWRKHGVAATILVLFASLRSLMNYGMVTYIPLLWHIRGGSLIQGASIITTLLVVGVIGNLGGGHLADRMNRRVLMATSSLLAAALIPLLIFANGLWVWVISGLLGIMLFSGGSVTVLVGQDIFAENRSLGSGIALGLSNGIGAMLVLLLGFFANASNLTSFMWLFGAAGIIAMLVSFLLPSQYMRSRH